jgi:hypothetical protein
MEHQELHAVVAIVPPPGQERLSTIQASTNANVHHRQAAGTSRDDNANIGYQNHSLEIDSLQNEM